MEAIRNPKLSLSAPKSSIVWPIILITIGFLSYAAYSYVNMERETIMADWANQRCNPLVMIAASYLKPENDPQTPGDFAAGNFQFCMKQIVQDIMAIVMAPVSFVMGEQANGVKIVMDAFNSIREIIATMMKEFMSFFAPVFKKFNDITYQIGIVFQKLKSAFQKANSMLLSTVFIGLSFIQTMNNMINLTIKVVFIILDIMIALLVILFFVLWPLIPLLIIPVIVAISSLGGIRGKAAASRKGAFCFVPDTPLCLANGGTCRIDEVQIGTKLLDGSTVEGILVLEGIDTPLFDLEGIHVSGSHLVKGVHGWHSVAEDERARLVSFRVPQLYCLNTSNRIIPIQSAAGATIQFRDWEEIDADDEEGQEGWDKLVSRILGKVTDLSSNDTFCLMDPQMQIPTTAGTRALQDLRIGDAIELSYNNSTRVIGLVKGRVRGRGATGWMSSCIQKISTATYVRQTTLEPAPEELIGAHVITESGRLMAHRGGQLIELRDFTEVGLHQIAHTYSFVAQRLNRPRSKLSLPE